MGANADKPLVTVATVSEWESWVEANPGVDGARLRLRKKNSAAPGITYPEALDVAPCFGWIDGQASRIDEDYHLQVFTPRRPRSVWSQRNREYVGRLIDEGRMRPAGLAEVERAKADGRWDAAYRQKDAPIPADLQEALAANPAAAEAFEALSAQNRFAILFRIGGVKRAETRSTKIATYVAMLERGETIHPQSAR